MYDSAVRSILLSPWDLEAPILFTGWNLLKVRTMHLSVSLRGSQLPWQGQQGQPETELDQSFPSELGRPLDGGVLTPWWVWAYFPLLGVEAIVSRHCPTSPGGHSLFSSSLKSSSQNNGEKGRRVSLSSARLHKRL